jgi:hypothetical protein
VPPSPAGCIGECTAASAGFLIRPVDLQPAESGQILAEDTVDLDGRRGMAAQKATGMRRLLAAVEADHAALRTRQEELEHFLLAAPPTGWGEAVAKARYLLSSSRMFSPTSSGCCRTETSARRGGRRARIRASEENCDGKRSATRKSRSQEDCFGKGRPGKSEESMKFRSLVS